MFLCTHLAEVIPTPDDPALSRRVRIPGHASAWAGTNEVLAGHGPLLQFRDGVGDRLTQRVVGQLEVSLQRSHLGAPRTAG